MTLIEHIAAAGAEPTTGAWLPGMPLGRRNLATVVADRSFHLEGGGSLPEVVVAYETWGTLAPDASNAVLVCHALTGDSHAAGRAGEGHPTEGWWDGLIGPGQALDTDRYFVVCSNVLGGCQGTTGPASIDPRTAKPYGSTFPVVTIRDMVRVQALLATHLGIDKWASVIGGSMGGMQVLEWAAMFPDRVSSILSIATSASASAQQIAWSMVGRRAILADPAFNGGDYYDAAPGHGPGQSEARELHLTAHDEEARVHRADLAECLFPERADEAAEAVLAQEGAALILRQMERMRAVCLRVDVLAQFLADGAASIRTISRFSSQRHMSSWKALQEAGGRTVNGSTGSGLLRRIGFLSERNTRTRGLRSMVSAGGCR